MAFKSIKETSKTVKSFSKKIRTYIKNSKKIFAKLAAFLKNKRLLTNPSEAMNDLLNTYNAKSKSALKNLETTPVATTTTPELPGGTAS